jgi:hypothetical protein
MTSTVSAGKVRMRGTVNGHGLHLAHEEIAAEPDEGCECCGLLT